MRRCDGRGVKSPLCRANLPGFHCCGNRFDAGKSERVYLNSENHIDLILLDIYMQQENGLIHARPAQRRLQKRRYCHFFLPLTPPPLKIRFTTAWWII